MFFTSHKAFKICWTSSSSLHVSLDALKSCCCATQTFSLFIELEGEIPHIAYQDNLNSRLCYRGAWPCEGKRCTANTWVKVICDLWRSLHMVYHAQDPHSPQILLRFQTVLCNNASVDTFLGLVELCGCCLCSFRTSKHFSSLAFSLPHFSVSRRSSQLTFLTKIWMNPSCPLVSISVD